jgi:hypothetical protein
MAYKPSVMKFIISTHNYCFKSKTGKFSLISDRRQKGFKGSATNVFTLKKPMKRNSFGFNKVHIVVSVTFIHPESRLGSL